MVGSGLGGPFGTVLANVLSSGGTSIDVLVTALEEKGVVRTLAEPNLIALSGDEAQFLGRGRISRSRRTQRRRSVSTVTIQFKTIRCSAQVSSDRAVGGIINLKHGARSQRA